MLMEYFTESFIVSTTTRKMKTDSSYKKEFCKGSPNYDVMSRNKGS